MRDSGPDPVDDEPALRIDVRDATIADAAVIADFNLRMAWETESLRLDSATLHRGVRNVFVDPSRGRYFVAAVRGAVVGCLLVTREWSDWRDGDLWWIQSVYVDKTHRRRGVFGALYHHVRNVASQSGARALRLYVERNNRRAKETYASLGMSMTEYEVMQETLGE